MIPTLVAVDALPLGPTGKVDRRALPLPRAGIAHTGPRPSTQSERLVAAIWCELLSLPAVGVDHSFFELGGHSLLGGRVLARLRESLGVELPLAAVFDAPTVRTLAARVDDARRTGAPAPLALCSSTTGDDPPASHGQEILWRVARERGRHPMTKIRQTIWFHGALDVDVLQQAIDDLVERHHSLRTLFAERGGLVVQHVLPSPGLPMIALDVSALDDDARDREVRHRIDAEEEREFDLARGPLTAATLLRVRSDQHLLLLTMDVSISDEWSADVLFEELVACYRARLGGHPPDLAAPIQYGDIATDQRRRLDANAAGRWLDFWRRELAGNRAVAPPADVPAPGAARTVAHESIRVSPEFLDQLGRVAGAAAATPFMLQLAAFALVLTAWTGQDDVPVGVPYANRDRPETHRVVGFFARGLVIRSRLRGNPSFVDLVRQVRGTALATYAHADGPSFVELEFGGLGALPYEVMFNAFAGHYGAVEVGKLRIRPHLPIATSLPLQVTLQETGAGQLATAYYDASRFHADTIRRLLRSYHELIRAGARRPQAPVRELIAACLASW